MINSKRQIRSSWQVITASVYSLVIRNLELRFVMRGSNKRLLDLLVIIAEPLGHVILTWSSKLTHLVKPLFSLPTISLQIDSDSHNQGMNASDNCYKTSKCNLKHLVELRSVFGIGAIAHVLV